MPTSKPTPCMSENQCVRRLHLKRTFRNKSCFIRTDTGWPRTYGSEPHWRSLSLLTALCTADRILLDTGSSFVGNLMSSPFLFVLHMTDSFCHPYHTTSSFIAAHPALITGDGPPIVQKTVERALSIKLTVRACM